MTQKQEIRKRVFKSMEEIDKEFLPRLNKSESELGKFNIPISSGTGMADAILENLKRDLKK